MRGEARREEVVDLLWRDVDEGKAKNAFRQALHRLRSALGDDLIPQDRERIKLVRSPRITIDLDQFEQASSAGRFDAALQLYSGDFLEDVSLGEPAFDHWAEQERTKLRVSFRQLLETAVTRSSSTGDWPAAVAHSVRLLEAAPFEASAAQLAATTLISAGRRVEAQELLRQFAQRLSSELGLPLPAELQSLAARIDRQSRVAPNAVSGAALLGGGVVSLPFVGRAAELTQLMTLWRTTAADAGALALVEGESGIGKTRLVRELASHAKSLGPTSVLVGSERAAGAQIPYGIFAEALRPLVRAKGTLGASRHLLAEAARLLPELRDEMDLPAVTDVDDDAGRIRFFEGIAALIDAAAFEQPILFVLEDLHFIPQSSLDLLSYLVVRLLSSAVMFVLTMRAGEASPASTKRLRGLAQSSDAGSAPHGSRAYLISLGAPTRRDLDEAALTAATALGIRPPIIQRILERAGGSPANLVMLLSRGALDSEFAALPVSLRDQIVARIERLASTERRAMLVMALIGRGGDARLVSAASHLPQAAANESIQHLIAAGLAERVNDQVLVPPFVAQVALEVAGAQARAFLAGWVAEALEAGHRSDPGELAHLYAVAGNASRAFENSRRAAYAALATGAIPDATQFLFSARTFATSTSDQREIESLLSAVGAGRRQLHANVPVDATSITPIPAASAVSEQVRETGRWRQLFPHWRLLLGAAVATLVVSTVVLAARSGELPMARRSTTADSLIVSEGTSGRVRYVSIARDGEYTLSDRVAARSAEPPWIDSLARPWAAAIASPRGIAVAVAKVTSAGTDVYVITSDRKDTIPIVVGNGDARPLGWSPDGRWLLASSTRTLPGGIFDSDLHAFRIFGPRVVVPIDTTARRFVTEASWSPDGSRIAWVARVGVDRQLDVFSSEADGSDVRNISHNPADDFHISWSGDGDLLAFTSTRDGNAEVYAYSFREAKSWRLTNDPAQDDRGVFSRSGGLIAFESTRGGSAGVYVMPSLGGEAKRVSEDRPLSIQTWVGGGGRYVNRVRASVAMQLQPGDTMPLVLAAVDQFNEPIATSEQQWSLLDSNKATLLPAHDDEPGRLVARHVGLVRVVGNLGHWRFDTAYVRIGNRAVALIDVSDGLRAWEPLGDPEPRETGRVNEHLFALNADREWESGILSRSVVPVLPGLSVTATVTAPFASADDPAMSVGLSLVAPEDESAIDHTAPQFLKLATFSWSAESGRFVFAVGREVYTVPIGHVRDSANVNLRIETDSTVSFKINGAHLWRSTLRIMDTGRDTRTSVWIGGRATGSRVGVAHVSVVLAATDSSRH
jgi:DNA-binding SARP family transcriptional activator